MGRRGPTPWLVIASLLAGDSCPSVFAAIDTRTAVDEIGAGTTVQLVVAVSATQGIVAVSATDPVVAAAAIDEIGTTAAGDHVGAWRADEDVVAVITDERGDAAIAGRYDHGDVDGVGAPRSLFAIQKVADHLPLPAHAIDSE